MASPTPVRRSSRHQNILAKHEENDVSKSNVCSKEGNIDGISQLNKNASPMVNGGRLNQLDNGGVLPSNTNTNSNIKSIISALPGNALSNCGRHLRSALKSSPRINDTPEKVLESNPEIGQDYDFPQGKPSLGSGRLNPEVKPVHGTPLAKSIQVFEPVSDTPPGSVRALRSRTDSNPETKHVMDTPAGNSAMKESNPEIESFNNTPRRRGRKKASGNAPNNEYSAIIDRVRYLLRQIKYRKSLINAYSGQGRKGQSTNNVFKKDIDLAESDTLKFKLEIRALFQHLDSALSEGQIDRTFFDSEGQIDSEDIYCAKCNSKDVSTDNDIILCDGMCVRAFHQKCLNPPLLSENIPVGDDGWLCPACECKIDCIKLLIEFQGSTMELTDTWEEVFPEAAVIRNGDKDVVVLPSVDAEDDNFDFCKDLDKASYKNDTISDESDFTSATEFCNELREPSGAIKKSATSVANFGTITKFGEEVLAEPDRGLKQGNEKLLEKGKIERLTYRKFHDETYSNSSSDSTDNENLSETYDTSDVDWRAHRQTSNKRKRRVRRHKKYQKSNERKRHVRKYKKYQKSNGNTHNQDHQELRSSANRSSASPYRKIDKAIQQVLCTNTHDQDHQELRSSANRSSVSPYRKIDKAIQQKLYESLQENHYPTSDEKEILAQQLGIGYDQVCRWINATRHRIRHGLYVRAGDINAETPKADKHPKRKSILPRTPLKEGTMIKEIDMGASPSSFPGPNTANTYVSTDQIDMGASLNNFPMLSVVNNTRTTGVNEIDLGASPSSFPMPSVVNNTRIAGVNGIDIGASPSSFPMPSVVNNTRTAGVNGIDIGASPSSFPMPSVVNNTRTAGVNGIDIDESPSSFPMPSVVNNTRTAGVNGIDTGASPSSFPMPSVGNNTRTAGVNGIDMGASPSSFPVPNTVNNFTGTGTSTMDEQANRRDMREKVILEIPLKEGTSLSQIDIKRQQAIARELKKMKQGR